ncbi:CobW family GTP-binding protein [Vibrio astriarenae]|jgi:G3E family GTPase
MSSRVPTNIITGFLGVGKTTAILNLLKNKPQNESWAVLVNEFGEIGIDGAMLTEQGALIKEVPGGCLCCTAGVPMSVGINALLRQKPDRLIIEPTGLGHPKQIVATLISDQYRNYIDLKATVALLDPRNLLDEKYTTNQNFNDQLASADVVIGNKVDVCDSAALTAFDDWASKQLPAKEAVVLTNQGEMSLELLSLNSQFAQSPTKIEAHHHEHAQMEPQFELAPGQAYVRKENKGQGHFSCGWLFGAETIFSFDELFSMLTDLTAERVKAVMNTDQGCYAFNKANGVLSVNQLTLSGFESRIEVIDTQLLPWDQLEAILLQLSSLKS